MLEQNEFQQVVGQPVTSKNWARPEKKILVGTYANVEPLIIDKHATALFTVLHQPEALASWTYLPYGPFAHIAQFCDWLKKTLQEPDTLLFAIIDQATQQPVGISGFLRITPQHGSIEVGHLHFSPQLKKTRLATDAMYLMMSYAFDKLQYRRYEWKCNALNHASIAAAKRLGFKFEGIFRQHNVFKGFNRDTAWFSIIDAEWPSLKTKFQKWLDPSNFDANGRQKMSLAQW